MTFFTVLGRTLKRLSFFWEVHKDPSKFFKARALVFTFSFLFLCVWLPMWYYKVYLPDEGYSYPALSKMNVDSGLWVFMRQKNIYDYIQTSDNRKILFDEWKMYRYREALMKARGLNPLSRFDPEIHVKVWWFLKPNSSANNIGKLEIEEKTIISYEDSYKEFLYRKDHSKFYGVVKVLLALMLTVLAWEFLVQYIKYRQENN